MSVCKSETPQGVSQGKWPSDEFGSNSNSNSKRESDAEHADLLRSALQLVRSTIVVRVGARRRTGHRQGGFSISDRWGMPVGSLAV